MAACVHVYAQTQYKKCNVSGIVIQPCSNVECYSLVSRDIIPIKGPIDSQTHFQHDSWAFSLGTKHRQKAGGRPQRQGLDKNE